MYVYIHIYIHTGVCEKNTPPEKNTGGEISFESTESGAGEQFPPLDCKVDAHVKGVFSADIGMLDYAMCFDVVCS